MKSDIVDLLQKDLRNRRYKSIFYLIFLKQCKLYKRMLFYFCHVVHTFFQLVAVMLPSVVLPTAIKIEEEAHAAVCVESFILRSTGGLEETAGALLTKGI